MLNFKKACMTLCCATALMPAASAAQATSTSPPQINFSGLIIGNFQYRTDDAARAMNRFELDRAYLTFRMPAGDRASVRVTTDVYQQQSSPNDSYYRGWAIRAKYAYLQYDFLKGKEWTGYSRIGMLNTAVIEHIEAFWPRFLSQVAIERAGFFSSADLGFSTQVGLPNKLGEAVAVIANGPGYTSRETDRFKDYSARLSLTPLSGSASALQRSFTLSLWAYKGAVGSRFAAPDAGQLAPIGEALRRDRYGAFVGVKDPGITVGVEMARRIDEGETGSNTEVSPRAVIDSTGQVRSAFLVMRPVQLMRRAGTSPFGVVMRRDWVTTNEDANRGHQVTIAGLFWDLSSRTTVALDYQAQLPDEGSTTPAVKTAFVHFTASF